MRITVRGWGRDQGEKEVMRAPLSEAERGEVDRLSLGTTYLRIDYPGTPYLTKARVMTGAELRLGGNYLIQVELSRKEIDDLFYEMHSGEIVRQFRSFVAGEERQRAISLRERIAETTERIRKEKEAEAKVERPD